MLNDHPVVLGETGNHFFFNQRRTEYTIVYYLTAPTLKKCANILASMVPKWVRNE